MPFPMSLQCFATLCLDLGIVGFVSGQKDYTSHKALGHSSESSQLSLFQGLLGGVVQPSHCCNFVFLQYGASAHDWMLKV